MNTAESKIKFDEYLNSIESLIDRHTEIDAKSFSDFKKSLGALRKKALSTKLKLAIVGEFSSGKSTFINQLLGIELLKVTDKPTTPVPILIHHVPGNTKYFKISQDESKQEISIAEFKECTSEESVIQGVKSLELQGSFPSLEKFDFQIIDTPGINSINTMHTERTYKAIKDSDACLLLINAKKPGAKSTLDFIKKIDESINKIFWGLAKSDTVSSKDAIRILEKLPKIIEGHTGVTVRNMFAIGYSNTKNPGLLGLDDFLQLISNFMINEWQNIFSKMLLNDLAKLSLISIELGKTDLIKLEEVFYKRHGNKPISFFEASDRALKGIKEAIPILLNENRIQIAEYVEKGNNALIEKYFKFIEGAWFKTTLAAYVQPLEKEIAEHQEELSNKLKFCVDEVIHEIGKKFSGYIGEATNRWENFQEKIIIKKAESLKTRLFYSSVSGISLGLLLGLCSFFLGYNGNISSDFIFKINNDYSLIFNSLILLGVTALVFSFLGIFFSPYVIFLLKLTSHNQFNLRRYTNYYDFLSNPNLSDLGESGEFLKTTNVRTKFSAIGGAMIFTRTKNVKLGLAAFGLGLVVNEFSGNSLAKEKQKTKDQILRNCELIKSAFVDTFDGLEVPIQQGITVMVQLLQQRYKNILLKDIESAKLEYAVARKPIDQLETFLIELKKISPDVGEKSLYIENGIKKKGDQNLEPEILSEESDGSRVNEKKKKLSA